MQKDTRLLVVMRHAKAEAVGSSDLERALTERGREDAGEAGRWLAERGFVPDHALVSAAVRTRDTWQAVSDAAGWTVRPDVQEALYAAGPESALDLIREFPQAARTALVLGHNPTVSYLAQLLSDGTGDPDVLARMAGGFPTASLTLFALDGSWDELELGTARVEGFHVGRP
ncbi:histidine phosphatase family protein [Nocardioides sp. 616]|uniref:SixA phosphatase family protein n=1 Tax=Nocardioides sp. 616 TaxID=2268090 RepID=UPI001F06169D|nr:histidine phosphatase family protein [Nocardioides sp. 616]